MRALRGKMPGMRSHALQNDASGQRVGSGRFRGLSGRRKAAGSGSQEKKEDPSGECLAREIAACCEYLVKTLTARGLTMTAVESCTGGMVAAAVTSVPGSSVILRQSYVTYCDDAKHSMVGVRRRTLRRYTAVSRQTAGEMAAGGAERAAADLCLSVTGYAGPASGDEEVGLVYVGCCYRGKIHVKECHFEGDRAAVRQSACAQALRMAVKAISQDSP